jgi:hypothetical protein
MLLENLFRRDLVYCRYRLCRRVGRAILLHCLVLRRTVMGPMGSRFQGRARRRQCRRMALPTRRQRACSSKISSVVILSTADTGSAAGWEEPFSCIVFVDGASSDSDGPNGFPFSRPRKTKTMQENGSSHPATTRGSADTFLSNNFIECRYGMAPSMHNASMLLGFQGRARRRQCRRMALPTRRQSRYLQ